MKRLLVTGRHGFVGGVLAKLLESDAEFAGWTLVDVPPTLDLLEGEAVRVLVGASAPDAVIHLASQSNVPEAFRNPEATLRVNVLGTLELLQALKAAGFRGRMIYAGTGDVYGSVAEAALPVRETHLPQPRNPYAVSKLAAEALCVQWAITEGLQVIATRPFNHIGPGQREAFVVSGMARQLAEIRAGRRPPVMRVGDIDVTRDFCDARDVVRAYFALIERGEPGTVYNICSGRERSVRSILDGLVALAGVDVEVERDPAQLRSAEQRRMCGDPSRIRAATGWSAAIPLERSLADVLEHWTREGGEKHG